MEICEAMAIELPGYVEGKLDSGTAAIVEKHVQSCAVCSSEVRELDRLNALLAQGLPPITPSPTFAATFAKRLAAEIAAEDAEEAPGGRRWVSWLLQPSWIPLAAAAALGVIMFTPWFNGTHPENAPLAPAPPAGVASATNPVPSSSVASVPTGARGPVVAASTATGGLAEKRLAATDVPADLLGRADLFVDFDVIRDLDLLESNGSPKAMRGEAG